MPVGFPITRKGRNPRQSQCADFLRSATTIVEGGATDHLDVAARIYADASRRSCRLLLLPSAPHVERPLEYELLEELKARHVLLLTGLPNAGKTHMARLLASKWQHDGYHAEEGQDIDKARRFLGEVGCEERIFVLDDPLGQVYPSRDASQVAASLRRLLGDVARHRKLIVTSRADILRSVLGGPPWAFEGHGVYDISLTEQETAASIWEKYATPRNAIGVGTHARVRGFLRRQLAVELLQPGQIRHLAIELETHPEVPEERWASIARYDGGDIGADLCRASAAMRDLLTALHILASTTLAVGDVELAFVLADASELPSKGRSADSGRSFDTTLEPSAPVFPSYEAVYRLTREQEDLLDQLERRGHLDRTDTGYRFSHPSYAAAAAQAIRRPQTNAWRRIITMCRKALFCMSPRNAMLSVSTIDSLYGDADSCEQRGELVNVVYEAYCGTIFPAVQDRCLLWLMRRRHELSHDIYRHVLNAIRTWDSGEHEVLWDEHGEAWLDPREMTSWGDSLTATSLEARSRGLPQSAACALANAAEGERLPPEVLWMHLYGLHPRDVSLAAIDRAFSYDESFLRARAACIAMLEHPDRLDWATRIFRDEHPRVFAAGLHGLFAHWNDRCHAARADLLNRALTAGISPEQAAAALHLLKVDDFGQDSDPPAEAWALTVARSLPNMAPMDTFIAGDLYHYALKFLPHLDQELGLDVVRAWLAWAERVVDHRYCGDETIAVARLWLLVTGSKSALRAGIVERLLKQADTAFFLNAISDLMDDWDLMDGQERMLVLQALVGLRPDARWARAVALTRRQPPREVIAHLLGAEDALSQMLRRRLEPISRQLFADCLCFADEAHSAAGVGVSGLFAILFVRLSMEPQHPEFLRALRWCIQNRNHDLLFRFWSRGLWPQLCNGEAPLRDLVFETLLRATILTSSCGFADLWEPLLADTRILDEELERWAPRVNRYAEAIEGRHNFDIFLQHRKMSAAIFRGLPRDEAWLRVHPDRLPIESVRVLAEALYKDGAPRLRLVHDHVLHVLGAEFSPFLEDGVNPDSFVEKVRAAIRTGHDVSRTQYDEARDPDRYRIPDWVWLYKIDGN